MLHLRYGKRGDLIIQKPDFRKSDRSGPQVGKRTVDEQSSDSIKHIRITQRTVIIEAMGGEIIISEEHDSTMTFYELYEHLMRHNIIHLDSSYVILFDHGIFLCPGFHFPLNETIEGDEPLIITELKRTELERKANRLQDLYNRTTIPSERTGVEYSAANYYNEFYQLKNMIGLYHATKKDIQENPQDVMREWWNELFDNLFAVNQDCFYAIKNYTPVEIAEPSSITQATNLIQTKFQIWIRMLEVEVNVRLPALLKDYIDKDTEQKIRDQSKSPPLIIDKDTLRCAMPGNLQTNVKIGSSQGKIMDIFLIRRLYLSKGVPRITYYIRDINENILYLQNMYDFPFKDPYFHSEVPKRFYEQLAHLAGLPREDNGVIPVIEWDDIDKGELYKHTIDYEEEREEIIDRSWFNVDFGVFNSENSNLILLPNIFNQTQYQNLLIFNCSNNQLKYLPNSVCTLSNLIELDCSNNKLIELPTCINGLTNLTTFNCSHNLLFTLPNEISRLQYLDSIDCSYNQLNTLPDSIGDLKDLDMLDCSYNFLAELPSSLGHLIHLNITLSHNMFPSYYYTLSWPELASELRGNEFGSGKNLENTFGFSKIYHLPPSEEAKYHQSEESSSFLFFF